MASNGRLKIIGTLGSDVIRIARGAISLDLDDDVDVTHPAGLVTVLGGQGPDFISGQGFSGRLPTLTPLDLEGGPGDDTIFGGTQGDLIFGEDGNDTLRSADQSADFVSGGPGFDNLVHDSLDNFSQVESEVTGSVGRLALTPRSGRARAGTVARLNMSWTHPKAWRDLRTVELRLYDRGESVGTIAVRPLGSRVTAHGALKLVAPGSRVTHSGKTVTARLAVRLPRSLASHGVRVDVQATDRNGHRQLQPDAGFIRVAK